MSIRRIESGPRMAQAAVANGLVFLAGQVADAKPARATVEASLVTPDYRVEIQLVALA